MKNMLKKLSRLVCLLLTVMMAFTVVGCSCNGNENPDNVEPTPPAPSTDADKVIDTDDYETTLPERVQEFGTHIYTAPEVAEDKWLVKDGATQYKVVVPADTTEANKTSFIESRTEFLRFFEQATGIVLEVILDTELPVTTHSADQHYISLGKTSLVKSLEGDNAIDYSIAEVEELGGKIKTVDNNIYIVGATDLGVWNTIYTFLTVTFNWECYSANTVVIDENVKNLKLFDYDVFDIPDVRYNATSAYERAEFSLNRDYGYKHSHATEGGNYYGYRMRVNDEFSINPRHIFEGRPEDVTPEQLANISTTSGHNSVEMMQKDGIGKDYLDYWFSYPTPNQLCYSARGNEQAFDKMVEYLANAFILTYMQYPVDEYPHARTVHLSITDDMNMCRCDTCTNYKGNLGYKDSGIIIRLLNEVADKVQAWMEKEGNERYRRDNFLIELEAYYNVEAAPAEIDPLTMEWVPVSDEVIMDDNLLVRWAPIDCDFTQSLFVEDNKVTKDTFDAWTAVSSGNISYFMYNYNCNYHNYFYDGFDFYNTEVMNYILSRGNANYYSENIHGTTPTEFGALISYVNAKLCYDSTLDSGKLIKNWFDAVYGPASGVMMDMFNQIRIFNHMEMLRIDKYGSRTNRVQAKTAYNWDLEILQSWLAKADAGLRLIENLKETDPQEYDRIAYNIELEVFSPIFIMFDVGLSLTAEQYRTYVDRIKNNINTYPEYRYVDNIDTFATK